MDNLKSVCYLYSDVVLTHMDSFIRNSVYYLLCILRVLNIIRYRKDNTFDKKNQDLNFQRKHQILTKKLRNYIYSHFLQAYDFKMTFNIKTNMWSNFTEKTWIQLNFNTRNLQYRTYKGTLHPPHGYSNLLELVIKLWSLTSRFYAKQKHKAIVIWTNKKRNGKIANHSNATI